MRSRHITASCQRCRVEGRAARERYDRYGGGLFPVAWYDLQSFFAARLPPGVLQVASAFERYEPGGAGSPATVHLRVRVSQWAAALLHIRKRSLISTLY